MRLKELRLRAKKTQKEIAEILNMSQTGYGKCELGKSEPNINVLKKLSKFYNVSIDFIVENNLGCPNDKSIVEFSDWKDEFLRILEDFKFCIEELPI